MKRLLVVLLVAVSAGCATQAHVNGGSGGVNTTVSSSRGALIMLGLMAIAANAGSSSQGGVNYFPNPFTALEPGFDMTSPHVPPPMDATRTVNEQDCSKPIENGSANLRCR